MFDYKRINEFKIFLQTELQNFEQESCPDAMANKLINTYNKGITHFSYIKHNSRKHTPRMPWISPAILHSISHKNKLFKDKLRQPSLENITKYNKYKNTLTNIIRLAKKNYYKREFDKNSGNTKETWRTLQQLINSKQKNKSDDTPASLTGTNGKNTTGDDNIAEQFNTYFAEIGENLRKNIPLSRTDPLQLINEIDNEMELEPTNENELVAIVKKLNNVGAGVDNINSKLFKLSYQSIIKYLVHFFNSCLRTGTFPSALKMAIIKPIFKGGDTQLTNNYRPISLLPIMSKILEKLIYRRLIEFVDENDIIHAHQFGFQKNKTTYMPILLLQDIITKAFEEGEFALGLYLDLRKAFDTVHIDILLKKLHKYGIRHNALKIMTSYLSGRTQCVKIRNSYSTSKSVNMGVPQGSILGPLLFLLYINDLPKVSPNITCLSYADDTAIIFKDNSIDSLQATINNILPLISDWFHANFLSLNISKTYTQHYSTRSSNFKLDVKLCDTTIEENEHIKYLGVYIDKTLKFSKHINHIANIISRNIGIIARVRYYIDNKTTLLLYNSLVLPYLNYCCINWGNNYDSQLYKVFILQKRAVRLIEHVFPPQSSEPIFKHYNLLKIRDIAKTQTLLVMHKYIKKQLPKIFNTLYHHNDDTSQTRQTRHLKQPFSNRNYRLFTSALLGPKLWNEVMVPQFLSLNDIPDSKETIKKIIKKHYVDIYHT